MRNRPTHQGVDRRLRRRWWPVSRGACTAATLLAFSAATASASQRPLRIVSLNLCTDQLLLALAPDRISALSTLADDPLLSVMAQAARRYPKVGADAEEVLRFDPDLVVAAPFAARTTVDLLRRLGRRVLVAELGQDIVGLRHSLLQLGDAIDAREKAAEIVTSLDANLSDISTNSMQLGSEPPAAWPTALVINYGGLPSGPGSLADAALRLAGYRNAAASYPADRMGAIPLEALVVRPPDLLVLGQEADDYHTIRADNLRHPAMRALMDRTPTVHLPQRLTLCATPHMAQAVSILAQRRADARRHARSVRP